MWGRMSVLGLRSTHYPLIAQDIIQKVDLKENRQPTSVKIVSGIVSADIFTFSVNLMTIFSCKMMSNLALNL